MSIDAIAIAAHGMTGDIDRLATISHNLANAATPGFKREMTVDRPFVAFLQAATANGNTPLATLLHEPRSWTSHRAGAMQQTGNPLDIAIEGDGFFELDDPGGPLYTRQGSFRLDVDGRLVDSAGRAVQGSGGELRFEAEPRIDRQGRILDGDKPAGQLRIVRFENQQGLVKLGGGVFSAAGQAPLALAEPRVRQGALEASNVIAADEMVRLIETMRHFESSQKVIQGCDEMLERAIRTLGEF